jgi:RNA polymerase sigma-70 factor, ECF subfamily
MMRVSKNPKHLASILLDEPPDGSNQEHWVGLLKAIAEGDQSALGALYKDTCGVVFGLILRIIGERSIAEEVLLEVFKQVWREAAIYDAQRLEPLAWLFKIARTRALDCLRRGICKNKLEKPESQNTRLGASNPEPQQASLITRQQRLSRAALASLPSSQRIVIELAYFQGLSQSEIAEKLALPLEAVKTDTRLAMMKLREFLNPVLQEQL